jgi:hypothetical protein
MAFLQRLSSGPTLADLIRTDADNRAAAAGRALPLAVWCRHSTLLMVGGYDYRPPDFAITLPSGPLLPGPVQRAWRAMAIRGCFVGASLVLITARLLLRTGLLRPGDTEPPLRWSSGLTRTGMGLWRRGRLRRRP